MADTRPTSNASTLLHPTLPEPYSVRHSHDTRHSSTATLHELNGGPSSAPHPLSPQLESELQRDEARMEKYGGDDPHQPPAKTPGQIPPESDDDGTLDTDLVSWDGPDDPANPQNWSKTRKWLLTLLCAVLTVSVTFASSAPSASTFFVANHFHVPLETTYLMTSLFLVGYVFGPLLWGPGSELIGRRPIFLITLTAYTLFTLGQSLAPNMATLLVTRFFGGFFAVSPLTNASGVIVDLWDPVGRGPATSLFTVCVFVGPVLGPIVGGFVSESHLGWRWVFWIMMIFAGATSILAFVFLPETYAPVLLAQKAKKLRKADPVANKNLYAEADKQDWSISGVLQRTLYRPFVMFAQEPVLVLVTVYMSMVYGLLYGLFEALPVIFVGKHGFSTSQVGLIFIGVGLGTSIGAFINYRATAHYPQLMKTWRGFPPPEDRLYGAMIGGPGLVIGCFWLGWTGQYPSVHWIVPALSTIVIGASVSLVFMSFISYLVDTYLMYAASAMAANTFIRSAVAAGFPLFTVQMFNNLGVNWACTLLGLLSLLLAPSPFLFFRFGARIRAHSKFAPCVDLRIAKEIEAERSERQSTAGEKSMA